MAIKIRSSASGYKQAGCKVCIYSGAGVGKTMTAAATSPDPLVIMTERGGEASLSKRNIEKVYGKDTPGINYDVPIIQAYTSSQVDEAIKYAKASDHKTIVFDSGTELSKILFRYYCKDSDKRGAYGEMFIETDRILRGFQKISKHVVILCQKARTSDEDTGITLYGPSFEGLAMQNDFPYLYGDIFSLEIDEEDDEELTRVLRTCTLYSSYIAKNRSGVLDDFEEPNLTKLFAKLRDNQSAPLNKKKVKAKKKRSK